jgi:hypothetical protein
MDNTRKKQLVKPMILILFSLILYGADMLYSQKTDQEELANQKKQAQQVKQVQVAPAAGNTGNHILPIQSAAVLSLETIPSPFALLSTATSTMNAGPAVPGSPVLPSPTTANLPIFPTGSGFNVPSFSNAGIPGRDVVLKAILYKPGETNMAILDDGTNEVIAIEGKTTEWGYISEITQHTVTIDGLLLSLDNSGSYQARPQHNVSHAGAAPILPPSMYPKY